MRRILYIIIASVALVRCELETEWALESSGAMMVADCIITNEFRRQELNLYWSADTLNQPIIGFADAEAEITDGSVIYSFSPDPEINGKYISDLAFRASAGRTYMLTIRYGNTYDTAFASMTGVSPLEEAIIIEDGDLYRYILNPSSAGYMMEILYDWSAVPAYCEQYGSCQAMEVFYVLNNIDLGKIFSPDKKRILFPANTMIIRKKYSLSAEHQEFARSLMLETEWRGGIFDAEAGNVPTNFRNGTHGWFAACTVVSDTLHINP